MGVLRFAPVLQRAARALSFFVVACAEPTSARHDARARRSLYVGANITDKNCPFASVYRLITRRPDARASSSISASEYL